MKVFNFKGVTKENTSGRICDILSKFQSIVNPVLVSQCNDPATPLQLMYCGVGSVLWPTALQAIQQGKMGEMVFIISSLRWPRLLAVCHERESDILKALCFLWSFLKTIWLFFKMLQYVSYGEDLRFFKFFTLTDSWYKLETEKLARFFDTIICKKLKLKIDKR